MSKTFQSFTFESESYDPVNGRRSFKRTFKTGDDGKFSKEDQECIDKLRGLGDIRSRVEKAFADAQAMMDEAFDMLRIGQ